MSNRIDHARRQLARRVVSGIGRPGGLPRWIQLTKLFLARIPRWPSSDRPCRRSRDGRSARKNRPISEAIMMELELHDKMPDATLAAVSSAPK
jgi:hypothetical protein